MSAAIEDREQRWAEQRAETNRLKGIGRHVAVTQWRHACRLVEASGDVHANTAKARVYAQLAAIAFDNPVGVAKALEEPA